MIETITGEGSFDANVRDAINRNFRAISGGLLSVGTVFFLNASSPAAADSNSGLSSGAGFRTLAAAYAALTAGKNDVLVIVGDGATTGTVRSEAAFTWAKNSTHLFGVGSPGLYSQRARIAPTGSTTAFTPFFTISGSGCVFQNIQWFHGFDTGVVTALGVVVTGSRNVFQNCHIAGMGDAASAQSAGSRSLKIGSGGSGENLFLDCVIGIDTVTRTQANASVEFAGATARNVFRRCHFPFMTSAAGVLGILGTGNGCVDRHNSFEGCSFINAIKSTSTGMTALLSFTTASPGGMIIFKDCAMVGVTKFGDTNGLANSYVDMAAVSASAGGLMVNPS